MAIDLSQIEELGVNPIPGDSPGGQSIQDTDDYDQLLRMFQWLTSIERGKEGAVKEIGGADLPTWIALSERSIKILRDKSKHLPVATYLIIGLFQEEGIPGLSAGLKLADGLLKNFWETMHPPLKLIKGRTSALEFMSTTIAGDSASPGGLLVVKGNAVLTEWRRVLDQNPSQSEFDANYEELKGTLDGIESAIKTLETLREKIYALFPQDKLPNVTAMTTALKDLQLNFADEVRKHKKPEPVAQAASSAATQSTASAPRPAPAPAAAIPSAADPTQARAAMVKMAPMFRDADPSDPVSYRLSRMGVFGSITELPPIKEGNQTRVPPGAISKPLFDSMNALIQSSNWVSLLNQTEARFPNAPLWLDQQFHTFRALKGMGPAYLAAARAVTEEVAILVRRLPGLPDLTFDGGIPFADNATRSWIETEVLAAPAASGGGAAQAVVTGGDGSSDLEDAVTQARGMAGEGKLDEAIALLQNGPQKVGSMRERFLWRMAMARIVQDAGKPRLTQPIWESLLDDIERYQLETWEPSLCVPVLHALFQLSKSDKAKADRAEEVFSRLCRVDTRAALSLDK